MKTIVSLYPKELKAERPFSPKQGQKFHTYVLPAASPDSYSTLDVEHAYEKIYQGESLGWRWSVIEETKVAEDLLLEFSTGRIGQEGGLGPGIFIKDPERFKEQLAEAKAKQEAYFGYLYDQGDAAHRAGRIDDITGEMRDAAKWLGRRPEWIEAPKQILKKNCPLCGSEIITTAVICPVCKRQIAKMPRGFAGLNQEQAEAA